MVKLNFSVRQLKQRLAQEKRDWRISHPINSILLLVILLVLMPASMQAESAGAPAQANGDCLNGANCTYSGAGAQTEFLGYINALRTQFGEPALAGNSLLMLAAQMQAAYLVSNNLPLSHVSPGNPYGAGPGDRMTKAGYNPNAGYGENLTTTAVPKPAFDSWEDSFGHCSNMLNAGFTEMGFSGVVNTGTGQNVGALVFGGSSGMSTPNTAIAHCCKSSPQMTNALAYVTKLGEDPGYASNAQKCLAVDGVGGYSMPQGIKDLLGGTTTAAAIQAQEAGGTVSANAEGFWAEFNRRLQADGLPLFNVNLRVQNFMENKIEAGEATDSQSMQTLLFQQLKFFPSTSPALPYSGDPKTFWDQSYGFAKGMYSGKTGAVMMLPNGKIVLVTVQDSQKNEFPADYAPLPGQSQPQPQTQPEQPAQNQTNQQQNQPSGGDGMTVTNPEEEVVPSESVTLNDSSYYSRIPLGALTANTVIDANATVSNGDLVVYLTISDANGLLAEGENGAPLQFTTTADSEYFLDVVQGNEGTSGDVEVQFSLTQLSDQPILPEDLPSTDTENEPAPLDETNYFMRTEVGTLEPGWSLEAAPFVTDGDAQVYLVLSNSKGVLWTGEVGDTLKYDITEQDQYFIDIVLAEDGGTGNVSLSYSIIQPQPGQPPANAVVVPEETEVAQEAESVEIPPDAREDEDQSGESGGASANSFTLDDTNYYYVVELGNLLPGTVVNASSTVLSGDIAVALSVATEKGGEGDGATGGKNEPLNFTVSEEGFFYLYAYQWDTGTSGDVSLSYTVIPPGEAGQDATGDQATEEPGDQSADQSSGDTGEQSGDEGAAGIDVNGLIAGLNAARSSGGLAPLNYSGNLQSALEAFADSAQEDADWDALYSADPTILNSSLLQITVSSPTTDVALSELLANFSDDISNSSFTSIVITTRGSDVFIFLSDAGQGDGNADEQPGDQSSEDMGEQSGDQSGESTGEQSGDQSGENTGDQSGDQSSEDTGGQSAAGIDLAAFVDGVNAARTNSGLAALNYNGALQAALEVYADGNHSDEAYNALFDADAQALVVTVVWLTPSVQSTDVAVSEFLADPGKSAELLGDYSAIAVTMRNGEVIVLLSKYQ